jgi:hypothetical protein
LGQKFWDVERIIKVYDIHSRASMVEISVMPARLSCTNDAITISRPEGLMLIYDLAVINSLDDTREGKTIDLSYRN